jgi:hypothetical protein
MKTILLSLILLGITEAILKPIMAQLTRAGIRDYLMPAYERLDDLLTIPENWQRFVDDAEAFIFDAVIPERLDQDVAEKLTDYLISNFDMEVFLVKTAIAKHVHQRQLNLDL